MTEMLSEPPPPPPPSDPRRLVRDPDDQVVAGVCAAFARSTDTDPLLWRVTVAVLALFGGAGLVLYVLGWLLVPRRGEAQSVVERTLRRPDGGVSVGGVALLVVVAVLLLAVLDGPGAGALLVIGGVAWLVARERREPPRPGTPVPSGPAPPPGHAPETAYGPEAAYAPEPWPGPADTAPAYGTPTPWAVDVPAPPRRRSPLRWLTLSAAALLTGLLLALGAAGVDGITAPRVVAAALLVVGAGLVVGTWHGRSRWLIAVGIVLALLLGATAVAQRAGLQDGVGERTWTVAEGASSYRLGVGEAVLDLSELEAGDRADVAARVGLGRLTVLVPRELDVRVVSGVGLGQMSRPGPDGSRVVVHDDEWSGAAGDDRRDVRETFVLGDPAEDAVELDLEVGVGEIEVRHGAA